MDNPERPDANDATLPQQPVYPTPQAPTAPWGPPAPQPPPPPPPPPSEPPAYSPPPAASPAYSPPPASAPTEVPPAFQQQFGAPYPQYQQYAPPPQAAPRQGGGQLWLIIGIIAVVVLAALGGGGVIANASLSSTYSPKQAVSDYFAAMGKGDVNGMTSNATFLAGDSGYSQFFGKDALKAMLTSAAENKQISDVKVGTVSKVDDSTSSVPVTLSWGGTSRQLTYNVRKDTSRTHFLFYPSWRVEVPVTTITISLPNQAGAVQVDGVALPSGSANTAEVIQGIHKITMAATDLYSESTQSADGIQTRATVAFPTALSSSAQTAASDSITAAFKNITCDVVKYFDCPNHQYRVPAGYYDLLPAAGGDIRANSNWSLVFEGDPTQGMQLTVTTTAGEVDASGKCGMKLTVDGSHVYHFVGQWTAKLTWATAGFNSDVSLNCDTSRS